MTHAPLVSDTQVLLSHPLLKHKQKRQGIFAAIIEALHYSRRLQAERYLRTNRHLIASSWDADTKPKTTEDDDVAR